MNHACACVVSTAVGAGKMLGDNENGLLYEYGNLDDLEAKIRALITDPAGREAYSRAAFTANRDVWNGTQAGKRLYTLMEALLAGKPSPFAEGLCSPAKIVTHEDMIRRAGL
jgi:glycosyltransferase involved in cell wall biosynthesis